MEKQKGVFCAWPLYETIKMRLLADYVSMPYYTAFPSEREICERYGVSRPIVRTARMHFTPCFLYDTLSEQGVVPYKGRQQVTFRPADSYETMHLQMKEGEPLSVLASLMYTAQGRLVEYAVVKSPAYKTGYEMVVYQDEAAEQGEDGRLPENTDI